MDERSNRISRLLNSQKSRAAYIKAKLSVLVPAQIRALRLKSTNPPMPFQRDLAREPELHQSRISMFETPGMANMTLETLSKVAAGLRLGVKVEFVPFSDMLRWEDSFSPHTFDVLPRLQDDIAFINPDAYTASELVSENTINGEEKKAPAFARFAYAEPTLRASASAAGLANTQVMGGQR